MTTRSSSRFKCLCIYMRIYERANTSTVDSPDAYENNVGSWRSLDLDLLMHRVRRCCSRRVLERHFERWWGSKLNSTVLPSLAASRRSGDFRADKVWASAKYSNIDKCLTVDSLLTHTSSGACQRCAIQGSTSAWGDSAIRLGSLQEYVTIFWCRVLCQP